MKPVCLVLGSWFLVQATGARAQDTTRASRSRTVDEWLAQSVRRPEWVRTGFGHDASTAVSFVGGFAPHVAAAGTWAFGALKESQNAHAAGRTTTQSVLAATLVTGALKFAFGRARPFVTVDSNSRDFKFGRGWRNDDYQSLPSGHSTAAFAFAAAMSEERARIRGRSRSFDVAMYGSATLVALSRMMLDKHWASDILLGAGIGVTSGLVTFRLAH